MVTLSCALVVSICPVKVVPQQVLEVMTFVKEFILIKARFDPPPQSNKCYLKFFLLLFFRVYDLLFNWGFLLQSEKSIKNNYIFYI